MYLNALRWCDVEVAQRFADNICVDNSSGWDVAAFANLVALVDGEVTHMMHFIYNDDR